MAKKDIRTQAEEDYPEFVEEVNNATSEQLTERLAQLAKSREEIQDSKEADDALAEAKSTASELAAPYRDAQKAVRLKSRFIIATLKERGVK